jgi:Aspartyl/Asparaginyl beta-hydroxylase
MYSYSPPTEAMERLNKRWWEALGVWYNDADYGQFMDTLDHALSEYCCEFDDDIITCVEGAQQEAYGIDHVERLWNQSSLEMDPTRGRAKSSLAMTDADLAALEKLLLFLAGCYLDAPNIPKARKYICRCLILCFRTRDSDIAAAALQELMGSYQEDPDEKSPWLVARRIVQIALDTGFVTKWKNVHQRAPYLRCMKQSQPLYDRSEYPDWCSVLERNAATIIAEFHHLQQVQSFWSPVGSGEHRGCAGEHDGSVVERGRWNEIVLFGSGARPELAPDTSKLLRRHCASVVSLAEAGGGEVIFSILTPHTRIQPHVASHNLRLTAHLGLQIPQDGEGECYLRVADHKCRWEQGKILVFDDSYEHEVVNESYEARAVLLLRFWHPSMSSVSEQNSAIQSVLSAKEADHLKRCNPPPPASACSSLSLTKRGMGATACEICGGTEYRSIRVNVADERFVCHCGTPI